MKLMLQACVMIPRDVLKWMYYVMIINAWSFCSLRDESTGNLVIP